MRVAGCEVTEQKQKHPVSLWEEMLETRSL